MPLSGLLEGCSFSNSTVTWVALSMKCEQKQPLSLLGGSHGEPCAIATTPFPTVEFANVIEVEASSAWAVAAMMNMAHDELDSRWTWPTMNLTHDEHEPQWTSATMNMVSWWTWLHDEHGPWWTWPHYELGPLMNMAHDEHGPTTWDGYGTSASKNPWCFKTQRFGVCVCACGVLYGILCWLTQRLCVNQAEESGPYLVGHSELQKDFKQGLCVCLFGQSREQIWLDGCANSSTS